MQIKLELIRLDGGTQARLQISRETVDDYADHITEGGQLPPILVYHDGAEYWLADGFHRWHAHKQVGALTIEADVCPGSQRDAVLAAAAANVGHGLRRSNQDKRRAVEMVLAIADDWSDRQIARHCGVAHTLVSAVRNPEVAQKQREHKVASGARVAEAVYSGVVAAAESARAESDSTKKPAESDSTRLVTSVDPDEVAQLRDLIEMLESENRALTDRLAVEAMDASEEEKLLAAETIKELRQEVSTLAAQVKAIGATRDLLMQENSQLKRQCLAQQRKLQKVAA